MVMVPITYGGKVVSDEIILEINKQQQLENA